MAIKFNSQSIKEAEDYYKTLHMETDQRQIIESMAGLVADHLPVPERAIKGFMWRAIKNWQVDKKRGLDEIKKSTSSEKVDIAVNLFEYFETEIKRIMIDKSQESLLSSAIQEGLNLYKQKFVNR